MGWLVAIGVLVALVAAFAWWVRGAQATPEELAKIDASLDAFVEANRDVFEATRRPAVAITLEPMAADDPRASKVGGAPWWPAGQPKPVDGTGATLVLLAQVDLEELPASGMNLPTHGLLQFFVAPDWKFGQDYSRDQLPDALAARQGHRVVFHPDASGAAAPYPAGTKKQLPSDVDLPLRMRFAAGSETMTISDARFEGRFPGGLYAALQAHGEPDGIDDETLVDALISRDEDPERHKLGGYPYFTQDDPRTRTDLELLFQLASRDGLMWGDAGVGNFFITDADLAARDFSRVFYSWDCC